MNRLLSGKQRQAKCILAIGGSKGGVGKTVVTVNLALGLSKLKKSVIVFDADLGNANCHTLLGIRHIDKSLDDYLLDGVSMDEIIVPTSYTGLKLICGASNKADQYLHQTDVKDRLLADLCALDYDYVIFDLGAGLGDAMLDLYNFADEKIMVTTPQFTALQNAYSFVKSAKYKSVDTDPTFRIIGNMANGEDDIRIINKLGAIVKEYLNVESSTLGVLWQSIEVSGSINKLTPFMELFPNCENSREIRTIALKIDSPILASFS